VASVPVEPRKPLANGVDVGRALGEPQVSPRGAPALRGLDRARSVATLLTVALQRDSGAHAGPQTF
jgi:hypothetical protein